jgi:phosphomethylpyrimidine synthase
MHRPESQKIELHSLPSQFPVSEKIYVKGTRSDVRVPFRKIELSNIVRDAGTFKNELISVYDTSGPYTESGYVSLPSLNWTITPL